MKLKTLISALFILSIQTASGTHSIFSWINPKLEVSSLDSMRQGLFCLDQVKKDELLAVFGGHVMSKQDVLDLPANLRCNVLQIADDLWIGTQLLTREPVDNIRHSCNPSAGLKGQIMLVAMRDIGPDEEITFDYAMCISEWVGMEPITCNCGDIDCRKLVLADDWRLENLQKKYNEYFSFYIQKKIDLGKDASAED